MIDDCSICLEPLLDDLMVLKCNHIFHKKCLLEWIKKEMHVALDKQTQALLPNCNRINPNESFKLKKMKSSIMIIDYI